MSASGEPVRISAATADRLDYINRELPELDQEEDKIVFLRLVGRSKPNCRISLTYEINDKAHPIDRFNNNRPVEATMLKVNGYLFNANQVELLSGHPFIATQAPHSKLEAKLLMEELFWHSLVQTSTAAIFNLTSPEEGCDGYTPKQKGEEIVRLGPTGTNFLIKLEKIEEEQDAYKSSQHHLTIHEPDRTHSPYPFLYVKANEWRDFNATSLEKLDALVDKVEKIRSEFSGRAILVHCRAGVGRTGTLIVACAVKALIRAGEIKESNYKGYIASLVLAMRDQRGPECVQRVEQLVMLFDYARKLLK
jgi:protein tyrosine phosphatase